MVGTDDFNEIRRPFVKPIITFDSSDINTTLMIVFSH